MASTEIKDSYGFERGEAIYLAVGEVIRIAVDWSQRDHGSIELPIEEWPKLKSRIDALVGVREWAMLALPPADKGEQQEDTGEVQGC